MIDGIDSISQLSASYFNRPEGLDPVAASPATMISDAEPGAAALDTHSADTNIVIGDSLTIDRAGASDGSDPGVFDRVMSGVAQMDGGYREAVGRASDWPSFSSYLNRHGISGPGGISERDGHVSNIDDVLMRAAPEISSGPHNQVEQISQKLDQQHRMNSEFYSAGIEYQRDSAAWYLGTEFWLTKVKVLTAAVSQVSRGLRTLFMSR